MKPWNWDITAKWKWLALALLLKTIIFAYFAYEFQSNWEARHIQNGVVIFYKDSFTYYIPVEEWVDGKGYRGACRMPGFLPIYAPLYSLFGADAARLIMIILQVLLDAIATYLIALWAFRIRPERVVFLFTFAIAAFSSFVSIWNNYALSDSWAVSTLIFAFYFLQCYGADRRWSQLLIAGIWMCWSIFFRPIHLLALPVVAVYLFILHGALFTRTLRLVKMGSVFLLPLTICISCWTWRNHAVYGRWIPLQDDPSVCYYNLQDFHLALRDNIIAWGMDFQEWSLQTEFAWFLDAKNDEPCPISQRVFTSYFNADSLEVLKSNYQLALASENSDSIEFASRRAQVIQSSQAFLASYQEEKPLDYYVFNRLRLLRLFLFSGRVDNLPLPARQDMSHSQFFIKLSCLLMLTAVIVLGLLGTFVQILRSSGADRWLLLYPVLHILVLGAILGYPEQRYLTPAYPFLVAASAMLLAAMRGAFRTWRKSHHS